MKRREFLKTGLALVTLTFFPKLTFGQSSPKKEVKMATDLNIDMNNKLGFGFMRLPVQKEGNPPEIDMEQVKQMVDLFMKRGFTYFDTAYMYMGYQSEIALREALVKRYPRDSFTIASKLPSMQLKEAADQERIFNEQLEKCGIDYFDYYLIHNVNASTYPIVQKFNSFDFVTQKKAEGKIKHIGFSFHDGPELLEEVLSSYPQIEFVQLQINYLDWDSPSIQSRKCYEIARRYGKPVIVMEPVKGGALATVPPAVEKLFKQTDAHLSAASWAIRYAASLDGVMKVLSGMSTLQQVEDNTAYMQHFAPLDEKEKNVIAQAVNIINGAIAIPCTACQYCVEGCPRKIPIPQLFALYNAEKQNESKGFSVQKMYYNNLTQNKSKASACIKCRRCEKSCPQHIEIVKWLGKVAKTFEE